MSQRTVSHMNCVLCRPLQDINRKSTTVVESWEGSKEKQSYTHVMSTNSSVSYTWAFQRTNKALDVRTYSGSTH